MAAFVPTYLDDVFVEACLSDAHPRAEMVARYMSRSRLSGLLRVLLADARATDARPSLAVSGDAFLNHLLDRRLAVPLGTSSTRADVPHWLRLRGGNAAAPNHYELATSVAADAVVSDISALRYWELNNFPDVVEFVRIVKAPRKPRPTPPASALANTAEQVGVVVTGTRPAVKRVGTVRFTVGDTEYRSRELAEPQAFGIRRAFTDEREHIRVLTLERSLLLSLTSPLTHGGTRGVLEAWQRASALIRADELVEMVRRADRGSSARRVGAMAAQVGRDDVADAMESLLSDAPLADDTAMVPLLQGIDGGRIESRFGVAIPW